MRVFDTAIARQFFWAAIRAEGLLTPEVSATVLRARGGGGERAARTRQVRVPVGPG